MKLYPFLQLLTLGLCMFGAWLDGESASAKNTAAQAQPAAIESAAPAVQHQVPAEIR